MIKKCIYICVHVYMHIYKYISSSLLVLYRMAGPWCQTSPITPMLFFWVLYKILFLSNRHSFFSLFVFFFLSLFLSLLSLSLSLSFLVFFFWNLNFCQICLSSRSWSLEKYCILSVWNFKIPNFYQFWFLVSGMLCSSKSQR